jgi:serine O-acetyltransferase
MQGTFRADMQRWVDLWTDHPGKPGRFLERVRLVWTHPPLRATALFRLSSLCSRRGIPLLPGILRRLNIMMYGLDIVAGIPVGGGLYMPHTVGTVVMAQRLGRNVTLVSNVTIGMRHEPTFPIICDDVFIGAGARVLGPVTIGNGASIGANAVVLTDVPPGATAVGVPARIIEPGGQARPNVVAERDS